MSKNKTYCTLPCYYIVNPSTYSKEWKDGFLLFKSRNRNTLDEYKGWYLSPIENSQPSCYDIYDIIKHILRGEIDEIEKIDEITFIVPSKKDLHLTDVITSSCTDEEIFKEIAEWFFCE